MRISSFLGAAMMSSALIFAAPLTASATTFTSQTAFDAANPGLPSANFNYLSSTVASDGDIYFPPTNPYSDGGVTFSTADGPGDLYVTNGSYFGGAYTTALSTEHYGETLTLSFSSVSAIGVTLASAAPGNGATEVNFTGYDGATQLFSTDFSVNDMSSPSFVGFNGYGPITSLAITPGGLPTFDTVVSVDGVAGAPEPGAWAMMLFGLGAIGGLLRRNARTGRKLAGVSSAAA